MSSSAEFNPEFAVPVMAFEYPDLAAFSASGAAASHSLGARFADGN
jgi:hypothetical protein